MEKSAATIEKYQKIFMRLWAKASEEIPGLDWPKYLDWLVAGKPKLARSTFRLYRAANTYALETAAVGDAALRPLLVEWAGVGSDGCKKKGAGTSAKRMQNLPREMLNKLVRELNRLEELNKLEVERRKYCEATKVWLIAGYWTGLRPTEWFDAEIRNSEEGPLLIVRNAKHSEEMGRATGTYRAIVLEELPSDVYEIVREHVKGCKTVAGGTEKDRELYYDECRRQLRKVARKIFPRRRSRPTLYSARHQFVANAKASGASLAEIAALCGHSTPETSATHYAKRRSGVAEDFRVRPAKGQVELVRAAKKSGPFEPKAKRQGRG